MPLGRLESGSEAIRWDTLPERYKRRQRGEDHWGRALVVTAERTARRGWAEACKEKGWKKSKPAL